VESKYFLRPENSVYTEVVNDRINRPSRKLAAPNFEEIASGIKI
jgi:hypothetical protein